MMRAQGRCPSSNLARWALLATISAMPFLRPDAALAQPHVEEAARRVIEIEAEAGQLLGSSIRREELRSRTYVEERIAEGEVQLELGDPLRASIIFTDIVEHHPQHRAAPDALYLLAESLFRAGDLFGARRNFRELTERAERDPAYRARTDEAIGRLLEIALRTRDFRGIEEEIARLDRTSLNAVGGSSTYYRGRYLYGVAVSEEVRDGELTRRIDRARLREAARVFGQIPSDSRWYARARYHQGGIHVLEGDLEAAKARFEEAAASRVEDLEERQARELALLAKARILYEESRIEEAIDAYQAIPRGSIYFPKALYEIAWAYIQDGDSVEAERALEVLAMTDPDNPLLADAHVLRANLLLRNHNFDEADRVFDEVRNKFAPIVRELDEIYRKQRDPRAFFRQLVRQGGGFISLESFLGPHIRPWIRTNRDFERALRVMNDLIEARRYAREAKSLAARVEGILDGARPIAIFGDLRAATEKASIIRSKLVSVTGALLKREEELRSGGQAASTPELAELRAKRRQLEGLLGDAPSEEREFNLRREGALETIEAFKAEIKKLEIELMGNEARINAMEHFMASGELDASARESVETEVGNHREAATHFRNLLEEFRGEIDVLRLQVGLGDQSLEREEDLRREYLSVASRERELLGRSGQEGVEALFIRMARIEQALNEREDEMEKVAAQRVAKIRAVVDEEREKLEQLSHSLDTLAEEAETTVAEVAHDNFLLIRDHFQELVIRADVGKLDIAWAVRNQHRDRLETLTNDRRLELMRLDNEFNEVMMDEGGEEAR